LARSDNPGALGSHQENLISPEKGFSQGEPFSGLLRLRRMIPRFSLRSNPGLELANTFGVEILAEAIYAFGVEILVETIYAFGVKFLN